MTITNGLFHQQMKSILKCLDDNILEDYFLDIKGKNIKEIFSMFLPIESNLEMCEGEREYRKKEYIFYLKGISEIDYNLAKEVSGYNDRVLSNGVTVPFYFPEILEKNYIIDDTGISFEGYTDQDIFFNKEKKIYSLIKKDVSFIALVEKNRIIDFSEQVIVLNNDEKRRVFDISYEHYSSSFVDSGSTDSILAIDEEEAFIIAMEIHDERDDSIYYSYSYEDSIINPHFSYYEAIERPGCEACA